MSTPAAQPLHSSTGGKSPLLTCASAVATPRLLPSFAVFHSFMAPKGMTPRELAERLHRRCFCLAETTEDRWLASQRFDSVFFLLCLEAICTNAKECWAVVCLLVEIYDESFATILAHAKVFAENHCGRSGSGGTLTFGPAAQLLVYWPAVQKKLGTRTTIGEKRVEEGMTWGTLARLFVRAYPIETDIGCSDLTLSKYACVFISEWYQHLRSLSNDQFVAAGVLPFVKLWSKDRASSPFAKLLDFVPPMLSSIPVTASYTFLYDVLALKHEIFTSFGIGTDMTSPGAPLPHARVLMDTPAFRLAAVSFLAARSMRDRNVPSCLAVIAETWDSVGAMSPELRRSAERAPAAPKRPRVRKVAAPTQEPSAEGAPPPKRQRRTRPARTPAQDAEAAPPVSSVLNEDSNPAFAFGDGGDARRDFEVSLELGRIDDYPDNI